MDAEDEEASTKPSPPLPQHSETAPHAPLHLSTTPSQCHTDLLGFPNAGGDVPPAPSSGAGPGGDHEAVIAGELSVADAVDAGTRTENKGEVVEGEGTIVGEVAGTTEAMVVAADAGGGVVVTEVGDLGNEGREMQVMDVKEEKVAAATDEGNETVEERMDDAEKGHASDPVDGVAMEGNEIDKMDDMDVETDKVEEDKADNNASAEEAIGQTTEDEITNANDKVEVAVETDVPNEAASMMDQEGGEPQEEAEDAAGSGGVGMAEDAEAALMEEEEGKEEQEPEEAAAGGGGVAADAEAALMEEEEEEEEQEEADAGGVVPEDTEAAEEIEVAEEEQSRSISGGKRKRGAGKNSKSTGRVPSKKKMEEDVCFICFDGGDLVLCDRR